MTQRTAAHQAFISLCHPLFLLPSISPSIRVFSNKSALICPASSSISSVPTSYWLQIFHRILFYGFCLSRFGNCSFPYDLISLIDLRSLTDFQFSFFFLVRMWFVVCAHAKSLQSCPTHWDLMDYSPPGSSVHRILQARILEWVAMTSSRGSSQPMDWTSSAAPAWQVNSLQLNDGWGQGRKPVWLFTCSLYITPEPRGLTAL